VIAEGFYESEVLEAVRPALVPGAVLWVVGANFGLHAIPAKMLHPEVTVVAFEPSPTMAARLLENCELNAVIIDLHVFALADRGGAWPFFANASGNPGMSTLHPVAQFPYDHRFTVATLTAADVLQRGLAPAPTVLILDVEGAETEVLNGFGATLGDRRLVRVIFEAENELLAASVEPPILRLLRAGGFSRFERLARHEHTAHTLSNFLALR
jgi:FkbM family methyltransferase